MVRAPAAAVHPRPAARTTPRSHSHLLLIRRRQPTAKTRRQLPAAVHPADQPFWYDPLPPHAGRNVAPLTGLRLVCVAVHQRPRNRPASTQTAKPAQAHPALAGAAWGAAINSPLPTRWAVKNAPSPSCKGASYSPLTLRVALQKFRYRRPWTSTPPPGPIRPRRCPPTLSLMTGDVGRPAGAFRRLRLPADDSPHAGGALPVQRSGHSQGRLELSAPQYLLTALHNASL